jgi:predicted ATPase
MLALGSALRLMTRLAHDSVQFIVLTGGPGAGKTAVLEVVRRNFCAHVTVLQEAASIVFGGGFPREPEDWGRRAAQRAIFHMQRELERMAVHRAASADRPGLVLCDRGTIDGLAYWPGAPEEYLTEVGTTLAAELARYSVVLHLHPPPSQGRGYQTTAIRIESPEEALRIDGRIEQAWAGHPRRVSIPHYESFVDKVQHVLGVLRSELPPACADTCDALLAPSASR